LAGIGFELKKLFNKKGLLASVRAYFYSIFVTIGPTIISVIVITFLQLLLKRSGVERYEREILQATIMYSFIFSVIIVSGYCMMLSRYLADRLYVNRKEDILPALYGSLSIIMIISAIVGTIFYYRSPLDIVYKLFAYLLFVELVIQMVLSVYISAVKNFKKIAYSFIYGTVLGIITGYLLIKYALVSEILSVLIGFDICIFVVILFLVHEIKSYFREKSTLYFNFMKYFRKFYLVFFTNMFYTLGLYGHNFVFWALSEKNHIIKDTYIYAPSYDIPAFYAFMSIMPTMVMFVVKVETAFYEKYRNYFYLINNGACYEDIQVAKKDMNKVIFKELIYIMEIQLFFSIGAIIIGMKHLSRLGFTSSMIDLYSILVLGFYCVIMMFVVMTLLLYFDNKKSACMIAGYFMITSFLYTYITIFLGESFYGLGFFISGLSAVIISIIKLVNYLKNIEYYVFCIQVSWKEEKDDLLTKFVNRLNKIGG
jgi:uncharacterized membrane protein